MGAVQRITDRLGRTRPRNKWVVVPGEAESPMDRNPTLEVSAALIASCTRDAEEIRRANSRVVVEAAMAQASRSRPGPAHRPRTA